MLEGRDGVVESDPRTGEDESTSQSQRDPCRTTPGLVPCRGRPGARSDGCGPARVSWSNRSEKGFGESLWSSGKEAEDHEKSGRHGVVAAEEFRASAAGPTVDCFAKIAPRGPREPRLRDVLAWGKFARMPRRLCLKGSRVDKEVPMEKRWDMGGGIHDQGPRHFLSAQRSWPEMWGKWESREFLRITT